MAGLTWLHLSDWHQKDEDFDRGLVLDKLLKDMEQREKISPDLKDVDFVVFSGDAASQSVEKEYIDSTLYVFSKIAKQAESNYPLVKKLKQKSKKRINDSSARTKY